jgi:hypothetical protein
MRDRTVAKIRGFKQLEWSFRNLDLGAQPPNNPAPHDMRVQGPHEHGDPPQGNAASHEPVAQFGQYLLWLPSRPGTVGQPIGDRLGAACNRRDRIGRFCSTAHLNAIALQRLDQR